MEKSSTTISCRPLSNENKKPVCSSRKPPTAEQVANREKMRAAAEAPLGFSLENLLKKAGHSPSPVTMRKKMKSHEESQPSGKAQPIESQPSLQGRERHKGSVVWFNAQRGFGFIKPEDGTVNEGKDLFVHFHYIVQRGFKSLQQGDVVEFCVGKNEKGVVAQEVKILQAAPEEAV